MNSQAQTQSWELGQPERIDANRANINWSEAAKFSEDRLKALQTIAATFSKEEEPFILKERSFLEGSVKFLDTFSKALNEFVRQEEENIAKIRAEMQRHSPEQNQNDQAISEMKNALADIERHIHTTEEAQRSTAQRKRELADQINPAELSKIKFKDFQDDSNNIFKWCLQVVYKESQSAYAWDNFKKQVFTKDKGVDFLDRLRGLGLQKLRKDDFVFTKTVVDHKDAYLADLEPKGKQNQSLRNLLGYMEVVVQYGNYHDQIEGDKQALEEKQREFEKKSVEFQKVSGMFKMLEQKVTDSVYYVETLNKLKPQFTHHIEDIRERIELQNQYLSSVKGNAGAVETLAQSQAQKSPHRSPTKDSDAERQFHQEGKDLTRQAESLERAKYDNERAHEEENFEGEQAFSDPHGKKVESRNVPTTDLKESEFANSKKGSCESCSMF